MKPQTVVSSDRFLIKLLDDTVTLLDLNYQVRNLRTLSCIYQDSIIVRYFGADFIPELEKFLSGFPAGDAEVQGYLHANPKMMKNLRYFFKMLRYAVDQRVKVSGDLMKLLRESIKENGCDGEVLHQDTLKTNFLQLMEMELYLRARYGGQLKNPGQSFELVKPSIDLFVDSLDKQFSHEYYW